MIAGRLGWTLVTLALLGVGGCQGPRDRVPPIAEIYRHAARIVDRNPVIVIHGILGSRLIQTSTGRVVWGAFTGDAIDPNTPEGARALALPLVSSSGEAPSDDVVATGPLDILDLDVGCGVVSVDVYASILRALGVGGYLDSVYADPLSPLYSREHFTCFSFFYDWRRDNVENAIRFGRYLRGLRVQIHQTATERIA